MSSGALLVSGSCRIADRPAARLRGLLGTDALGPGEGLLIAPARSIHTCFMRFPIDAVFLGADMRVVALATRVPPWRFRAGRRARMVLELAAGECDRLSLRLGDRLRVEHGAAAARVGGARQRS